MASSNILDLTFNVINLKQLKCLLPVTQHFPNLSKFSKIVSINSFILWNNVFQISTTKTINFLHWLQMHQHFRRLTCHSSKSGVICTHHFTNNQNTTINETNIGNKY